MMMWITDPATLFQEGRPRRTRRLFKPGEGLPLKVDGVKALPHDLRLVALEGLSPILAGDVLTLGGVVWALNQTVRITERDGAALLARTRKGGYRGPKASDVKRFWDAAGGTGGNDSSRPRRVRAVAAPGDTGTRARKAVVA